MRKINPTALFVILLGITTLILFCALTNGQNWGDDFSSYIMQAKSITELNPRGFIEANRFTVENSSYHYGAPIAYPWGFPVLLAPFYAVFGLNMIGLKLLGVISFLIFIVFLWVGFRKYHSPIWLLCLVCFFSLNPNILSFTDQILSDLPFLLVSTASVLFMGRLVIEKRNLISTAWDYILLGAIIAGAFFIRTNGILLLITLAITQFIALVLKLRQEDFQNDKGSSSFKKLLSNRSVFLKYLLINLIPYISFFCIFMLWETILPKGFASYPSYLSNTFSLDVILNQMDSYIDIPIEFFIGVPHCYLFYFASIPIAIAGIIKRYRSDYHIVVYIILTFVLYILWSSLQSYQGLRYLFPILPFYFSFVITGLDIFQGGKTNIEQKLRRWVCLIPILFIFAHFAISSIGNAYSNMIHHRETISGPYAETSQSMFSFIRSNTEKESTIVFFKPRLMRMMTDRKSIMLKTKGDLLRGDYLCLYLPVQLHVLAAQLRDQVSPDTMQDLVKHKAALLIFENSEFKVYKLTYSKFPFINY
jgi:Dolichyl-phosphate-mannose-protein mannosyltransferase